MTAQTLPESVRDAWGEIAARDFSTWFEATLGEQTISRQEWTSGLREVRDSIVDLRTETSERFDRLQSLFDQRFDAQNARMDARFDALNAEMDSRFDTQSARMDARIDAQNDRIDARFDAMNDRLDKRFASIEDRFERLDERILIQTRWSIGILALFGTMITALLSVQMFIQ